MVGLTMLFMKYFVLKPEAKSSYDVSARASQKAMRSYAREIAKIDKEFAKDLKDWADDAANRQDCMSKEN